MAARKNITVVRQPKREINKLGADRYERAGNRPPVVDPIPSRTPLNVYPKMDGTPEMAKARNNFTTPFNLTPKVADVQE
jgi:hypothetical protein